MSTCHQHLTSRLHNRWIWRNEVEFQTDYWEHNADRVIRHHYRPRTTLFSPDEVHDGPDLLHLEMRRVTNATMSDGQTLTREDQWQDPTTRSAVLDTTSSQKWTGTTVFFRKPQFPQLLEDDLVDSANAANTLPTPPQPTEAERELHILTHLPFKSWCKICQQAR